jgi:uncharacterized protein (TIGR01440 family)
MLTAIRVDLYEILLELLEHANIEPHQMVVIGTSTSEVLGQHIGKAGAPEVAEQLFRAVQEARAVRPFCPAFQCCEHLNRALVVEREIADRFRLTKVSAIPVPKAGGSMAAYAYQALPDACLVEAIQAHAGVDVGDTLIGMHLRPVAVPFRPTKRLVGEAHVTTAFTRPKLIGGSRAVYDVETAQQQFNIDHHS